MFPSQYRCAISDTMSSTPFLPVSDTQALNHIQFRSLLLFSSYHRSSAYKTGENLESDVASRDRLLLTGLGACHGDLNSEPSLLASYCAEMGTRGHADGGGWAA